MSCGIYKITNLINNKVYIGQSINIESRWTHHKNYETNKSHYPLYCAFKKYGIENFKFEIIELCSIDKLNTQEQYWINFYDSYKNGYNLTIGGQGTNNLCIKLSSEEVEMIYDLLIYSDISQKEIAKQFNVGEDTISEINHGKTRRQLNYSYPLRKNHKTYFCIDCGKPISKGSLRCIDCNNIFSQQKERPTREKLKEEIRNYSFVELGLKYGVADNTIRKWCKKHNLPTKRKDIKQYTDNEWKTV